MYHYDVHADRLIEDQWMPCRRRCHADAKARHKIRFSIVSWQNYDKIKDQCHWLQAMPLSFEGVRFDWQRCLHVHVAWSKDLDGVLAGSDIDVGLCTITRYERGRHISTEDKRIWQDVIISPRSDSSPYRHRSRQHVTAYWPTSRRCQLNSYNRTTSPPEDVMAGSGRLTICLCNQLSRPAHAWLMPTSFMPSKIDRTEQVKMKNRSTYKMYVPQDTN